MHVPLHSGKTDLFFFLTISLTYESKESVLQSFMTIIKYQIHLLSPLALSSGPCRTVIATSGCSPIKPGNPEKEQKIHPEEL